MPIAARATPTLANTAAPSKRPNPPMRNEAGAAATAAGAGMIVGTDAGSDAGTGAGTAAGGTDGASLAGGLRLVGRRFEAGGGGRGGPRGGQAEPFGGGSPAWWGAFWRPVASRLPCAGAGADDEPCC